MKLKLNVLEAFDLILIQIIGEPDQKSLEVSKRFDLMLDSCGKKVLIEDDHFLRETLGCSWFGQTLLLVESQLTRPTEEAATTLLDEEMTARDPNPAVCLQKPLVHDF